MNNIELIGWIGGIMLAICGAPQSYKSWVDGHSDGLTHGLLWLWYIGEWLTFAYILSFDKISMPLLLNYSINIILVTVMVKYKYFPRGNYDRS